MHVLLNLVFNSSRDWSMLQSQSLPKITKDVIEGAEYLFSCIY